MSLQCECLGVTHGDGKSKGASKGILSSSPSKIEPTEDYAIFRWTGAAPNLEKSDVVRIRCDRVVDKRLVRLFEAWKEDLNDKLFIHYKAGTIIA